MKDVCCVSLLELLTDKQNSSRPISNAWFLIKINNKLSANFFLQN